MIPSNGIIKVLIVTNHEIANEYSLTEYKDKNQIKELGCLFFSEQVFNNGKTDSEYQRKLLEHFNSLKKVPMGKLKMLKLDSVPNEVGLMVHFLLDVMFESFLNPLHKCSIGGMKVFIAYSINKGHWVLNEYPNYRKPFSLDEFSEDLGKKDSK